MYQQGATARGMALAGTGGYVDDGGGGISGGGVRCGACGCTDDECGAACGCGNGGAGEVGFVGVGRGSFVVETQYRYVGAGKGDFDVEQPAPTFCTCVFVTFLLGMLTFLILWSVLNDRTATTTSQVDCVACLRACQYVQANRCNLGAAGVSTGFMPMGPCSRKAVTTACMQCRRFGVACQPPASPPGTCVVWGDPHVLTFDHKRADFYTEGEYWIVKSATVHIQGLYRPTHATNGLSVMKQIAFGGPFLNGHKLIIAETSASWNGQPVLAGFPSNFQNELVTAQYNANGGTMQQGRAGKPLHIIHLSLPLDVNVQVNRWMEAAEGNYINAKITMTAQPGQDGHCGNFNGNLADDDRLQIRARIGTTGVAPPDLLFPGPKTPIGQSHRPDINNCARNILDRAKLSCKAKEHKFIPSMACLVDVCFGGPGFANDDGAEGM